MLYIGPWREGINQYLILAGDLDSFAYRGRDLVGRLRVFEVDHPGSQEWKRRRLKHLGVEIPTNLVFAPVDFERQTLRDGLESAGFDFMARSILSWIGVTVLLTRGAIDATLRDIASALAAASCFLRTNSDVPRPRARPRIGP